MKAATTLTPREAYALRQNGVRQRGLRVEIYHEECLTLECRAHSWWTMAPERGVFRCAYLGSRSALIPEVSPPPEVPGRLTILYSAALGHESYSGPCHMRGHVETDEGGSYYFSAAPLLGQDSCGCNWCNGGREYSWWPNHWRAAYPEEGTLFLRKGGVPSQAQREPLGPWVRALNGGKASPVKPDAATAQQVRQYAVMQARSRIRSGKVPVDDHPDRADPG